ncbi:hypothetical protein ACFSL6_25505 [Paenibacillus thailandensis]|uniref:hypothetical protein n=1 Tax=Paenibacillus thailandensis TaxID=393250 RepID=UPI00362B4C26
MRSLNLLIAGLIVVILFASCSKQDKLEINSTSFMYSADSSSDQKIQVELNGYFDNKDNYFKGILKINDGIEYPTVLFSPGLSGLIAYNGKERIYLGEIFFDKKFTTFHARNKQRGSILLSDTQKIRKPKTDYKFSGRKLGASHRNEQNAEASSHDSE